MQARNIIALPEAAPAKNPFLFILMRLERALEGFVLLGLRGLDLVGEEQDPEKRRQQRGKAHEGG